MSTQTALDYRTNRDLFSNYHLDEHLPETKAWNEVDEKKLQAAYDDIKELWDEQKDTVERRNESQLEEKFIRPMFRRLGIPFEVEESANETQRRPDYGFFETEADATDAFQRREDGGDFYQNAVAVADAKRWGRKLDTRGEKKRDYENPSHQIDQYLRFTSTTWGVLTNGQKWRLYYKPTSHKLDSYYEIDLPTVLETGSLEQFKYFYLFFRHEAFVPDASGDAFLDDVYEESNLFAQDLGQDLQDNIYDAIVELSEGFLQYPENDLDEDKLDLIHDSSLIYLYRIIFVLYAEAEGRDLLDTNNEIYESQYSLNQLKQEVAEELESGDPKYRDWQDNLHSQLDELFTLIDQGSRSRGIPEGDLYIPAYNGGLFRTNPDESGSKEARFLATNTVGDEHLARVIELLTRSESSNGAGKIFVDYSSLDVRHLGSIYEGLLEYQLNVADEPLALDDGEYVVAEQDSEIVVERDDVYLTTDSGERKATGSYYTPEYVVEYIVDETLRGPVDEIRKEVVMDEKYQDGGYADEFAKRVFDLKVLDPAMGSGHFLTSVVDYLARAIVTEQNREADEKGGDVIDDEHDINWARRKVAQRCIYGVDINPLATELAKVSLWLRTLAAEQPLAFLDHHLKTGNSLVGSDIEEIEELESEGGGDDQNTSLADFGVARKGTIEQLMRIYEDFIAIENQELADVKKMESKYDEFERNKLRQRLEAMTNVHTAEEFGLNNLPSDAYQRIAAALKDDEKWATIESLQWFKDAQAWADENNYFHWKLEYPEVFYDENGNQVSDPGFDAVIGNPPYIRMEQIKPLKPYLSSNYDVHDTRVDLYGYFIERSLALTTDQYGVVVSNKWIKSKYGEKIRSVLDKYQIEQIVDFGDLEVFDGATAYPCILTVNTNRALDNDVFVTKIDNLDFESLPKIISQTGARIPAELFNDGDWTVTNPEIAKIDKKLKNRHNSVSEYIQTTCETDIGDGIGRGVVTGLNEAFLISGDTRDTLIEEDKRSREIIYPCIKGTDISRYSHNREEQYIIYCYSGIQIDNYPAVKSHLRQHKSRLEGTATDEEWYELQQPQEEYIDEFSQRKIIYPDIAKHSRFSMDTNGDYLANTVFMIPSEDYYLLSLLNSKVFEVLFGINSPSIRGGYHRYINEYMKSVPVPIINPDGSDQSQSVEKKAESLIEQYNKYLQGGEKPEKFNYPNDDSTNRFLTHLSKCMLEYRDSRASLNLTLLDYLGNYKHGQELPNIGLFQPAESNILDTTTEEYENLRIGDAKAKRDGTTVTISATARYKPEDEDEFETDAYGYRETEYHEAFTLMSLSEQEAGLIAAFVPVAVQKADGFAGFRDNATKTNSLLDRLKAITLPDPDNVANDLERYTNTKRRADELNAKIDKTDQLIDEIVYDLYELTDKEIEIVESAVQDD